MNNDKAYSPKKIITEANEQVTIPVNVNVTAR